MSTRYNLTEFSLANPLYIGQVAYFYTVSAGVRTTTLADLYTDTTGSMRLTNPQRLDREGKFAQPVYVQEPVIAVVGPEFSGGREYPIPADPTGAGTIDDLVNWYNPPVNTIIAGYSTYNLGALSRAFRWDFDTGMLPLDVADVDSYAYGISGDGNVIVGTRYDAVTAPNYEAFSWTQAGGYVDLGYISGSAKTSTAHACSFDGSVIVGRSSIVGLGGVPFIRTVAGGMVAIEASTGVAYSVSEDGTVVAGELYNNGTGKYYAFRWTQAGGVVDLGLLPGGTQSFGYGISGDGIVVVGMAHTNAAGTLYRAFRWTQAGGMVDLGTLGGVWSRAYACSLDGSVVVGQSTTAAGIWQPFRWTQAGGMVALGLTDNLSVSSLGISRDGTTIVGFGSFEGGLRHEAFRWTAATGVVALGTLGTIYNENSYGYGCAKI